MRIKILTTVILALILSGAQTALHWFAIRPLGLQLINATNEITVAYKLACNARTAIYVVFVIVILCLFLDEIKQLFGGNNESN